MLQCYRCPAEARASATGPREGSSTASRRRALRDHAWHWMKRTVIAASALGVMVLAGGLAASSVAAALPTVTEVPEGSGSHGYPYDAVPPQSTVAGAPKISLSEAEYTEREFIMSGGANIFRENGNEGCVFFCSTAWN